MTVRLRLKRPQYMHSRAGVGAIPAWNLSCRSLPLLQRRINRGIGADLVVRALSPSLDRKVRGIDPWNAALAHYYLAKDVPIHRNRGAEEPILPFIRRQRRRQLHLKRLERNLFLQLAEGHFVHANAAKVEAQNH